MTKRWDVLGLGAVAVDDIYYVENYPVVDTKEPIIASVRQAGGLAGTALVTVSRLGGKSAYLGVFGDDDLSLYSIKEFEREGVDISLVHKLPGARPIHSIVIVEKSTGARTVFFDRSGQINPSHEVMSLETLLQSRVLFVDYTVHEAAIWADDAA